MTAPLSLYDQGITVTTINGATVDLDSFRGQVLLIVNVASRCGFTPQYAGLERLYRTYRDRGFTVLGFPCDQFAGQEPGADAEIQQFCALTYDVTFPLFSKVKVNGPSATPLYRFLKSQRKGTLGLGRVMWNFTKFLVDREGIVTARFGADQSPERIEPRIAETLASGSVG